METQPRSLNTLYKLLWDRIKKDRNLDVGLCAYSTLILWIGGIINNEEDFLLTNHIKKNMPNIKGSNYGWGKGVEATNKRKEFVQRMIKETDVHDTNVTNI